MFYHHYNHDNDKGNIMVSFLNKYICSLLPKHDAMAEKLNDIK